MEIEDKNPMEDVEGIDQSLIDEIMREEDTRTGTGEGDAGATPNAGQHTPAAAAAPDMSQSQTLAQTPQQQQQPQQFDSQQAYTALQNQMQVMTQLLQQMQQAQAQPQQQQLQQAQQPPKDEDPLAGIVRQHLEAVLPSQLKPIQDMQQQFQQMQEQQARQVRTERSIALAQAKYPDFIEVVTPIHQRMLQDQAFNDLVLNMPDPAEFAYMMALGMKAQTARVAQGQAQVNKMQQMAAMPRSMQVKSGGAPTEYANLEDLVNDFDRLTPAQQEKLLKSTGV